MLPRFTSAGEGLPIPYSPIKAASQQAASVSNHSLCFRKRFIHALYSGQHTIQIGTASYRGLLELRIRKFQFENSTFHITKIKTTTSSRILSADEDGRWRLKSYFHLRATPEPANKNPLVNNEEEMNELSLDYKRKVTTKKWALSNEGGYSVAPRSERHKRI